MEHAAAATTWHTVGRWVRLVVVLAVVAFVGFVGLIFAWASFAGARFGWAPSLLAFGGLGYLAARLAVTPHWRRTRITTTTSLAAAGAVVGLLIAHAAPPTPGRLRHAIEELADPGWHFVHETVDGNALCFDTCTGVSREYRVAAAPVDVASDLKRSLEDEGFIEPTPGLEEDRWDFARQRGDVALDVEVRAAEADGGGTVVAISARAD